MPISLDYLIQENHDVRIVNDAINKMSLDPMLAQYM